MRFEVDLVLEEGQYKAAAVEYPEVSATGRTEKEALGLLMEALGRYMKQQAQRGAEGARG